MQEVQGRNWSLGLPLADFFLDAHEEKRKYWLANYENMKNPNKFCTHSWSHNLLPLYVGLLHIMVSLTSDFTTCSIKLLYPLRIMFTPWYFYSLNQGPQNYTTIHSSGPFFLLLVQQYSPVSGMELVTWGGKFCPFCWKFTVVGAIAPSWV